MSEQVVKTQKPQFHTGEFIFKDPSQQLENFEPQDFLDIRKKYRSAAKIHRKVREYCREKIIPGADLYTAVEDCEGYLRQLCNVKGAAALNKSNWGQAFPMGVSVNNVAAHYSPLKNDTYTLTTNDMVKVDFGVHYCGYLIDSAFTLWWNDKLDVIAQASKEATNAGIKTAGIDVRLCDIGKVIEEVITSYEYEGKPIQPVRNLCGHKVNQYTIHDGQSIPLYYNPKDDYKMKAGEVFACETFASTGNGLIKSQLPVSHYMVDPKAIQRDSIQGTSGDRQLFKFLKDNFGTLAWCPRYLDTMKYQNYSSYLDDLVKKGYVNDYPQLADKKGCYVSQFEHTFMVSDWGTEIFSRSDDY